jgi:uncharacterized protein (DUF2267 family)
MWAVVSLNRSKHRKLQGKLHDLKVHELREVYRCSGSSGPKLTLKKDLREALLRIISDNNINSNDKIKKTVIDKISVLHDQT